MRALYLACLLLALVSCRSPAQPLVVETPLGDAGTVTLPALLADPLPWIGRRFTLIALLAPDQQRQVLVPSISIPPGETEGADLPRGVWLAQPAPAEALPDAAVVAPVLKLRGMLSPPGAYGPDGQYVYQFSAESAAALLPERTTVSNLAENPQVLDGLVVEVEGHVLVAGGSAILAEEATAAGVPSTEARQIKLRGLPDPAAIASLQRQGDVSYGRVTTTGWWQDGVLTVFVVKAP